MPYTLQLIIGAIVALGLIGALLGAVVSHHVGGFLRTVEREAEEERRRAEEEASEKQE